MTKTPLATVRRYVVGFLFHSEGLLDDGDILLIRKARPAWQANSLNGVGGKVEPGETGLQAMAREFQEEAAYKELIAWEPFATISGLETPDRAGTPLGEQFIVEYFRAKIRGARPAIPEQQFDPWETAEPLEWHWTADLPRECLPNLAWLIPMALREPRFSGPPYLILEQVPADYLTSASFDPAAAWRK
jgi:8-oxo-dGTP pyrophosphatase MutT (NUDIX family)